MDTLLQDLRYALRQLRRSPGFTVVAVLTLALGIGATTAIFSVVDAVLLEPLPYDQPDRLVRIWNQWEGSPQADLSPAEYFDYRERLEGFEAVGAYAIQAMNLAGGDAPEQLQGGFLSAGVFRAFGVEPALGRVFTAVEDGPGSPFVVLSDGLWRRRFGAEPEIVGRSIMIDGQPTTVIGVMPPAFRLPEDLGSGESTDLFVPLGIDRATIPNRGSHFLIGVGRLAPGVDVTAARSEIAAVAAEFVRDFPDEYPAAERFTATVDPLRDTVLGPVRPALMALLGAVSLVLLIACANVAGLLLARTAARRREFAVRSALGAGRARVLRQLVVESLLLALAGGAAGLLVALLATDALATLQPGDLPRVTEVGMDLRVLAFALALSVVTGLAFGLVPALRTTPDLQVALREGDRGTTSGGARRRSRGLLVAGEIALALVLLLGAGLLLRSFARLQQVDPGFRTENILTLSVSLPEESYPAENEVVSFFERLLERVEGLPGVRSAGAVAWLPLASSRGDLNFTIEGRPIPEGADSPDADWQVLTPGYLSAIGMEILRGRPLRPNDDATAPGAVVINETMADLYWPGEDPLGRRFLLGGGAGPGWVTVVGITRDVRYLGLDTPPRPEMYLPHAQFRVWGSGEAMDQMTLAVRTAADPTALVDAIRSELHALDPTLPVAGIQTMEQVAAASVAQRRFMMLLLLGFAGVALALAAVGIYGVMAYTVAQRTQEIGIRMALGAEPGHVAGMVVRQGMLLALVGIATGCVIALGVTRALSSLLYEVSPTDPATIAGATFVLAAVALLAAWLPARRATRVDPLVALRSE